jgi:hypothetical protein
MKTSFIPKWSFILVCNLLILSGIPVQGKALQHNNGVFRNTRIFTTEDIHELERRLTPLFRNRVSRRRRQKKEPLEVHVTESDLLQLYKVWHQLSDEFKTIYAEASVLQDSFKVYLSPGGHFSVYYTINGIDAVDPEDNYHFNTDNWREKISGANGVPDYIDEAAFALDSAWSMEIIRFGFIEPLVYKTSTDTSDRYKVVVESLEDSFYGYTYLKDPAPGDGIGFSSSISLRNDWSDPEWSDLGYDKEPIKGVRVTCVHEFFHAIQYSMSQDVKRNVYLDDFPLGWIEGTAVSMEELAFSSINDYHQYSRSYFITPSMSFFSEDDIYSNAILVLYLFEHAVPGGGIDFMYHMHYNNYRKARVFDENLIASAKQCGTTWSNLLHSFHINSHYTGVNADTSKFIRDAAFFTLWEPGATTEPDTQFASIKFRSVKSYKLMQANEHIDTVELCIASAITSHTPEIRNVSASLLLQSSTADSVVPLTFDTATGICSTILTPWKPWNELNLIITNSAPEKEDRLTSVVLQPFAVHFQAASVHHDTLTDTISNVRAILSINAKNDIRMNPGKRLLSLVTLPETDSIIDFHAINTPYMVTFPSYLKGNAELTLSLVIDNGTDFPSDMIYSGHWNSELQQWNTLDSAILSTGSPGISFSMEVEESGMYLLFYRNTWQSSLSASALVFPNPFSLKNDNGYLNFRGRDITDIYVYTITGNLIWHRTDETESRNNSVKDYRWEAENRSGKTIVPGTYPVVIVQDNHSGPKKCIRHKLVITP